MSKKRDCFQCQHLEVFQLCTDRTAAAHTFVLMILSLAHSQKIIMTYSEAFVVAMETTPRFRLDWVNPN